MVAITLTGIIFITLYEDGQGVAVDFLLGKCVLFSVESAVRQHLFFQNAISTDLAGKNCKKRYSAGQRN
jgi:hypothetical protein